MKPSIASPHAQLNDAEAVRRQTQTLLDELESVSTAESQLPLRACVWVGFICGLVLVLVWGLSTQGALTAPEGRYSTQVGLGTGLVMLLTSFVLSRMERLTVTSCRVIVMIGSVLYCAALVFNGLLPAPFLSMAIVYTHMLIRPRDALAVGLLLWLATGVCAAVLATPAGSQLSLRILGGGLLVLVLMQLITRQGSHLIEASHKVLRGLKQLSDSQSVALQQALHERDVASQTDAQTGLLNMRGLEAQLTQHLASQPASAQGALVAFRLQRFDECMSVLTPSEQHLMMRSLLARLAEVFGPNCQIAHLGNAKFAAFWTDAPDAAQALTRSESALSRLQQPILAGPHAALMVPCMGIIHWPEHGRELSVLLRGAQIALLIASDLKLSRPVVYEGAMQATVVERDSLVRAMQQALTTGEFELHYQAIRNLQGGPIRKAEALIRWNHPQRGRVSPAEFIPLAEATGQIVPITEWVMTEACRQLGLWRQTIDPGFQISINMPPAYIEYCSREPDRALQRLRDLDVPHHGITLEITEGALLTVTPEILQVLAILKGLGFQIALDDFGVGYSCFAQLDNLPLDFLKIDKSLVNEIDAGPKKLAICRSIIHVAHELGFQVVAEGVETPSQSHLLTAAGCDFGQGYLFSRPVPAAELQALAR
jgi:EAL domain-containing protein (putative c-di-GMP-specific phosphodiesterase class I)/GGDEF domain-containing protein